MRLELFCLSLFFLPLLTKDEIVGGPKTTTNKYPFMVRLSTDRGGCTASLVKNKYILTAKHCFEYENGTLIKDGIASFRDSSWEKERKEFKRSVKLAFHYPKSDLALAKISGWVKGIKPVKISKKRVKPGALMRAVGFGMHGFNKADGHLREIDLEVSYVKGNQIGTKVGANNEGPCAGDSGGPLLVQERGKWSVVGTLEGWGYDCRTNTVHHVHKDDIWSSVRVIKLKDLRDQYEK